MVMIGPNDLEKSLGYQRTLPRQGTSDAKLTFPSTHLRSRNYWDERHDRNSARDLTKEETRSDVIS